MSFLVDSNGNPISSESPKVTQPKGLEINNDARITAPRNEFNPELDPTYKVLEILDTNYIIGEGPTALVEVVPIELMITRVLFFGKRPLTPIGIEMTNPNPTILQKVTIHFSNEVAQTDIYKSGKLFYRVGEGMVPENEHQPIV